MVLAWGWDLLLLVLQVAVARGHITFPLVRRTVAGVGIGRRWLPEESGVALDATVTEDREYLQNFADVQYILDVSLGTPAQTYTVLIDTGSSDLWIKQNPNLNDSKTLKHLSGKAEIIYGQGMVEGDLEEDTLRIGQVNLGRQTFMVPTEKGMQGLQGFIAQGVLGLAFPLLSHTGTTVLQHMQTANVTKFSLFLGEAEAGGAGSYIAFGEPSESFLPPDKTVWVEALTDRWWAFLGVVGSQDAAVAKGYLLLDSGTSFIGLPPPVFELMIKELIQPEDLTACTSAAGGNAMFCACAVIPNVKPLVIEVAGRSFTIFADQFFSQPTPQGCMLEFLQLRPLMPMIMGDTFLRTVNATFDAGEGPGATPRIGLAQRKHTEVVIPYLKPSLPMLLFPKQGLFVLVLCVVLFLGFWIRGPCRADPAEPEQSRYASMEA